MSLYSIPCVVFAGGKSSRMGEDKAFLPFGQSPSLVQYQYERLEKIFSHVYISAKDKNKFAELDIALIEDILHKEVYAPTAGLVNTFKQLKTDNAFFVLSVDSPFVGEKVISRILEASDKGYDAIIVRTPRGIHPLCGVYTRALEEPLKKMIEEDDHKLTKLLKSANVFYLDVEDEDVLLNLNTPSEYARALSLLQES